MMKRKYNILTNVLLVLCSTLFSLILVEVGLRFVGKKYNYAAEAKLILSQSRIFLNEKKSRQYLTHPDTNEEHLVITNSLGLRQHRDFNQKKPDDVIRIGFFGDSYVENRRMAVQYSFTEPLDYLLCKTGAKYEVLNFGVDGYGTDQIFLQYLEEGIQMDLDAMFYVYCNNDLRNINENNLLTIDKDGNLRTIKYVAHPFMKFINKLYITYFLLSINSDLKNRLYDMRPERYLSERLKRFHASKYEKIENDFARGLISPEIDKTLQIYFAILSQLKDICNKNNTKFYVVIVPSISANNNMANLLIEKGYKVLNLYEIFRTMHHKEKLTFKNDAHWNEEANKLAAVYLFKFLARELSIEYEGEDFIEQALYEYYSSFRPTRVTSLFVKKHTDFSEDLNYDIRSLYLSLE